MPIKFTSEIRNNFSSINAEDMFGVVRNGHEDRLDLKNILKKHENWSPTSGFKYDDYYVKPLKKPEMKDIPSQRFINSVTMYNSFEHTGSLIEFPKPIALVYTGDIKHVMTEDSKGLFIAEYVKGKTMLTVFNKLDLKEKELFFSSFASGLFSLISFGMYLFDFAPRDVIITRDNLNNIRTVLVDTEHVGYSGKTWGEFLNHECDEEEIEKIISNSDLGKGYLFDKELIEKQIAQFKKDYEIFFEQEELEKITKSVFYDVRFLLEKP